MTMDVILEQFSKTPFSILVTELGIMTELSPLQYAKAPNPILVTEFGMAMEARHEHSLKA